MPLDHLMSALADCFLVGLYAGNRLSEWAQPDASPHQDISQPQINIFSEPSAFSLGDFIFATASLDGTSYRKVYTVEVALDPLGTNITCSWLTWRTQKNGPNGEVRMFTFFNPNIAGRSCVAPMLPIAKTFYPTPW